MTETEKNDRVSRFAMITATICLMIITVIGAVCIVIATVHELQDTPTASVIEEVNK